MRFAKVYIEISNICNLSCSFCPGTVRKKRQMTFPEFKTVLNKLKGYTEYLYFHLLGEPLLHPDFERFLTYAQENNFKVTVTTNGTLINSHRDFLSKCGLYKIVFSLHSFEANTMSVPINDYLDSCFSFGREVMSKTIVVFRLWNYGGENSMNDEILSRLRMFYPQEWQEGKNGTKIANKTFLQFGDKFDWPSLENTHDDKNIFCYGLRDQIGILADGTLVPCCLDSDGTVALGNIFESDLEEILNSERAKSVFKGFSERNAPEELCRKCTYARRFR